MQGSLKGKEIKNYLFGDALAVFEPGSEVASAIKDNKIHVTVYGIANTLIDPNTFPEFNNEIANNVNKIYPVYYENVRSQNFLYIIFESVSKVNLGNQYTKDNVRKLVKEIQRIFNGCTHKIKKEEIFMKNNSSGELCVIMAYSKNLQKSSNLYSKYHNRAILSDVFCEAVKVTDKFKCSELFTNNIENSNLCDQVLPFVVFNNANNSINSFNTHMTHKGVQSKSENSVTKSNANKLIKEMEEEYPEIDEKEYEELMAYVHVNPTLKKEAGEAYMRQSARERVGKAGEEIGGIVEHVKSSIFNIVEVKTKSGKSKLELNINKKKLETTEFEVHFETYYKSFSLFKTVVKSFLEKYRNGFAGIIAAYLLTLIATLRRLKLYTDLEQGIDVFELGEHVRNMNFNQFTQSIRKELAKEARNLANLKTIIENADMPYKTYEALLPFLNDDLEEIDLAKTQSFCFFYMTVLMKMRKERSYHDILVLEIMYILINSTYDIVYSEEELPKSWNQEYYELKKVLIETLVLNWSVDS